LLWAACAPIRLAIRLYPFRKGRGRMTWVLDRLLGDRPSGPRTIVLSVPRGGIVEIERGTSITRAAIAQGQFEASEIAVLVGLAKPATVAFDIGANVGLFTVALARAVGPTGRVVAVEPYPPSIEALASNIARNGLDNVTIVRMAVGSAPGTGRILVEADPALISVLELAEDEADSVPVTTIDSIWYEMGRPVVSAIKIDVEGSEVSVLRGATNLLATGPCVLVETRTSESHVEAVRLLEAHGYVEQPARLESWNHLFARPLSPCPPN
jgi:FkbM family methyltransferase